MMSSSRLLALLSAIIALSSYASAHFWGSSTQSSPEKPPHYYYHKRLLQGPTVYAMSDSEYPVPTVPIQVPLQAQFAPTSVRNVQLVPCLCPVTHDYDYDKVSTSSAQDTFINYPTYQTQPASGQNPSKGKL